MTDAPPTLMPSWQVHGGRGPHLLLVHGFLSSRAQWRDNLEDLADVCQPVTLELFGHGRSPSPADIACYTPDYYVACFEEIRRSLGAQKWLLLGYSLGAGLTIRYALRHADRVIGHVFTNSTSGFADSEQISAWQDTAGDAAARIRSGGQSALERIPVHPRHGRNLPESIRNALVADASLHNPHGVASTLEITNPQVSVRTLVKDNQRPACLVFGSREKRFHKHKDYAMANMPGLELVTLDAGHGVNMEQAASFNAAVRDFVTRCHTS